MSQANRLTKARAGRRRHVRHDRLMFVRVSHGVTMQRYVAASGHSRKPVPIVLPRRRGRMQRRFASIGDPARGDHGTLTASAIRNQGHCSGCKATARLRLQSRNMPRCPPAS